PDFGGVKSRPSIYFFPPFELVPRSRPTRDSRRACREMLQSLRKPIGLIGDAHRWSGRNHAVIVLTANTRIDASITADDATKLPCTPGICLHTAWCRPVEV